MTLGQEECMFKPVSSKVSFPEIEKRVLGFWKEHSIFQKTTQLRSGAPQFTLYDGPPTINGNPGIHHVLSRVYKDVIPRYKTMKGFCVFRKAGWDTHGLPVELEVEKELGFSNKAQIEEYGIARFNARCRENVLKYLKGWEELTERIGFWLDMEHPYVTFDNSYIESCWWIIKTLWDRGLIYQGYRVTPHCPRCGTSLSSHEVALGYQDVEDPSIYIRFRLSRDLQPADAKALPMLGWDSQKGWKEERPSILAWTTTPWTLTGNVALAVAPDADYVLVQSRSPQGTTERLILAKALLDQALGAGNWEILSEFPGRDLASLYYERLYEPKESFVVGGRKVLQYNWLVTADFVSMEDGTGVVHIAPAFGEEDYDLGKAAGLPIVQSVDLDGKMIASDKPWDGRFVKEADPMILKDLEQRNLLHHQQTITHTYPFCWRCDTPLLYYAKPSWYIKTTALKGELISGNEQINWYPEYIKHGRFGEWLKNNVDWALSRERFWGTPLPIWQCEQCHRPEAVGSIAELRSQPDLKGMAEPLDLHRSFVDGITFRCSKCGGTMRRVPEVLDAWFDSGAMPVAQFHYPFENQEQFDKSFPADYICEAVDQTRGWFYTLHALSTLLFQRPCFKNVICLGHILDAKGEKMSKAKGNVVDPWTIINNQGADALRWYMFTSTPAGNVKRFSRDQVTEVARRFLSTLWNTYSFFVLYANIDRFDPTTAEAPQYSSDLDRWITSEVNQLILDVSRELDNYNPTDAGRRIEEFVERLSNWYVRRSRRRFWKSENDADKLSAYFTLYHCMVTLCKLLAPLTPFIAEEIYQNLVRSANPEAEESVHLCAFPEADPARIDELLAANTRLAMKVCSLGRAARSTANIKVRQPLPMIVVKTKSNSEREGLERLASQILEELNVKRMEFVKDESELVGKAGYSLAVEGDHVVALSTDVPHELIEEGLAREVVHRLQTMRRNAGFDIADYIITRYQAEPPLLQAIQNQSDYIKQETLSLQLICQAPQEGDYTEKHRIDGHHIMLAVRRVES